MSRAGSLRCISRCHRTARQPDAPTRPPSRQLRTFNFCVLRGSLSRGQVTVRKKSPSHCCEGRLNERGKVPARSLHCLSTPRCHSRRVLVPPSARRMKALTVPSRGLTTSFDRSDLSPASTTGWSADRARLALVRLSPPMALSLLSRSPTPPVDAPCQGAGVGASRVSRQGSVLSVLSQIVECAGRSPASPLPRTVVTVAAAGFPRPRFPGRFRYSRQSSSTPT